jgi:membrane-bound lytic murein transglycosylase D
VRRESSLWLIGLAAGLVSACAHDRSHRVPIVAPSAPGAAGSSFPVSRDSAVAPAEGAPASGLGESRRDAEALPAADGARDGSAERSLIDDVGDFSVEQAKPSPARLREAENVVRGEATDFPVELNDMVVACIDLYQGRLRDWFQRAVARGARLLPHAREVFASEGLPRDLAYVALVESAFVPTALSQARAKGVWQFMPATGRRFGLEQDWWIDERSDPEKATRAAARYLKDLFALLGDWNLALAGYNSGEGTVLRAIARHGTSDFWALSRARAFGRETRNYVPLVHAAIIVAKAPDRYGFTADAEGPETPERVPIRGAIDLRVVGECVGLGLDEIRRLNPELRRLATPAGREHDVKVPRGSGLMLLDCLRSMPAHERSMLRVHTVTRGQSLSGIARAHSVRVSDLAAANGLSTGQPLAPGTRLVIPAGSRVKRQPTGASTLQARARRGETAEAARLSHTVRPGDTLGSIASLYGTTVRDLQSWNSLRDSRIAAGATLTVFTHRRR